MSNSLSSPKVTFTFHTRTKHRLNVDKNSDFFPVTISLSLSFSPSHGLATDDLGGEDEEIQWQDRVSVGFDRLVAFATELNKTCRPLDGSGSSNAERSPKRELDQHHHHHQHHLGSSHDDYRSRRMKSEKSSDYHHRMKMPMDEGGRISKSSSKHHHHHHESGP